MAATKSLVFFSASFVLGNNRQPRGTVVSGLKRLAMHNRLVVIPNPAWPWAQPQYRRATQRLGVDVASVVSAHLGVPSAIRQYLRDHRGDADFDLIMSYVIGWDDVRPGGVRFSSVEGMLSGSGSTMILTGVEAVVTYILHAQGHVPKNGADRPGLTIRVRRVRTVDDSVEDGDPP